MGVGSRRVAGALGGRERAALARLGLGLFEVCGVRVLTRVSGVNPELGRNERAARIGFEPAAIAFFVCDV